MTQDEYIRQKQGLQDEFDRKMKELNKEYAFSNNPYKIGDAISDHQGKIKIEQVKWGFAFGDRFPTCVYIGTTLKKDLTPPLRKQKQEKFTSQIFNHE